MEREKSSVPFGGRHLYLVQTGDGKNLYLVQTGDGKRSPRYPLGGGICTSCKRGMDKEKKRDFPSGDWIKKRKEKRFPIRGLDKEKKRKEISHPGIGSERKNRNDELTIN
jgi:hypothetical protein